MRVRAWYAIRGRCPHECKIDVALSVAWRPRDITVLGARRYGKLAGAKRADDGGVRRALRGDARRLAYAGAGGAGGRAGAAYGVAGSERQSVSGEGPGGAGER